MYHRVIKLIFYGVIFQTYLLKDIIQAVVKTGISITVENLLQIVM